VRGLGVNPSDGEIYEKHSADLIRYATVLVGPDEALDVVSTVVLRVLKRRRSSRVALGRFFEREVSSSLDAAVADRVSAAEAVWRLPPRLRSAAYLVYWLDLSISEAAQMLGVSSGTVKRYVHEARERIREELS
jgi:DNA-directed RNA polymerase specialized sigma24 family protein